ncbi:MAG: M20/M25/M40 family metallo-hydrolase [Candidatus Hodarchaeales archaeon]
MNSHFKESDQQLSSESIFGSLRKVCVHTEELQFKFVVEDRRDAIRELCNKTKLEKLVDNDYLLIYCTKMENKPGILFSVHIDTVFKKDQHGVSLGVNGTITGTLDNTASIAAMIEAMKDESFIQHSDIFISFTGGEEKLTMNGAKLTARYFKKEGININYIVVLDITAENFDKDVSIENFIVEQKEFEQFIKNFYRSFNISTGFVPVEKALPDETIIYRKTGINTFSLCLPVCTGVKSMHETGCKTTLDKLLALTKATIKLPAFLRS